MASIVLSAAGASVGASIPAIGGVIGGALGRAIGGTVGGLIDNAIFGTPTIHQQGARLADLSVQVSTYGKMIPMIYGSVRIAGNVIWSRPIKETVTTTTSSSGGGKGGGSVSSTTTNYSYSISLAIAVSEGEIGEIQRVWADAKDIDFSNANYRIYNGRADQLPDSFIESFEGIGATPAYRGVAYVVIEDFPLAEFGNRIPNFTFEVSKSAKIDDYNGQSAEEMITGVNVIPAAGEFVYDTKVQEHLSGQDVGGNWVQAGFREYVNKHNPTSEANALLSLNQLEKTCPNLEWVSVVVAWFGDDLDAGLCNVYPAVEFASGGTTEPDKWSVAGKTRQNATEITKIDGVPRYGGTPDDASLVRYIDEIQSRGKKVMILPMVFMDLDGKPWRGHMTGTSANINNFFTKTDGYNEFINHYANLLAGKVDAFAIGSELVGLTKVTDVAGNYPAVNQLVTLAGAVKSTMNSGGNVTKITYAADWSEYHHTDGGWYHLDPLWSSPDIDMIGIDAYFPLTDAPQRNLGYDVDEVIAGWSEGEGYDWYYSDVNRTIQTPLSEEFAWKNIAWWWSNNHVNPDLSTTSWIPQSKKIWFTEYGYPSIDGATNQPNVFYDPTSSDSGFPYHSEGYVDFRAQRNAIVAAEALWENSNMVEQKFLWNWDARPYPYFPYMRDVWSDGGVWATGHWVTGKFGMSSLAAIVQDLCVLVGLDAALLDTSRLKNLVEGFVITSSQDARSLIESLMSAYFFDAVESGTQLKFIPRGDDIASSIESGELLRDGGNNDGTLLATRIQEIEMPERTEVVYLSRANDYQPRTQIVRRHSSASQAVSKVNLPLVISDSEAKNIADISLYSSWISRTKYRFMLSDKFSHLEASDVVSVSDEQGKSHIMRIVNLLRDQGKVRIDAVSENRDIYLLNRGDDATGNANISGVGNLASDIAKTELHILDLPVLPSDHADNMTLRYAFAGLGENWQGAVIYRSEDEGANYGKIASGDNPAIIGQAITALPNFTGGNIFDETSEIEVLLIGNGELESTTDIAVLGGANAAVIGSEIIQFRNAIELGTGYYRLSGLLRGRLGTEWAIDSHISGEIFVLLDGSMAKEQAYDSMIGGEKLYKAVSVGRTLGSSSEQAFIYDAVSLKPYSPVHVEGIRNSSDDVDISWIRRSRTGGKWRDLVDMALAESSEQYELEILDGTGGNVLRSVTATSPSYNYDAASQIADFGAVQLSIAVNIYQLSEQVGRGYVSEAEV